MPTEELFLKDFLILLLAVLIFVPLFQRIHISTILAYLVAGVVIGPFGLSLISNVSAAEHLGEFGVVFLLFAVGLEIKFERFRLFGARVFALGIAQVVVTALVLGNVALLFGLPLIVAAVVGAALALSSTAVVLQLLAERSPMSGALGRIVLPILLVQDIAVGPLLVFTSVAARGDGGLGAALGIDSSEPALDLARRAAAANGVAAICTFRHGEAFASLEALAATGERFRVVVADPPAFVKTRRDVNAGLKGYRKLARLAAAVVEPHGFLFVASCSHSVEPAMFASEVVAGLDRAGRAGRIIRAAGAGPDHPVHPHLPETAYLKTLVVQID